MNTNPSLVIGLAMDYAAKNGATLTAQDHQYAELRVYPNAGAGCFFVRAHSPGRWYWKDESGSDHFNRADQAELDAAIAAGARVQLVGTRASQLALWRTWQAFEKEMQ